MAYHDPTPAEFKARFPVFNTVGDVTVQGALDEAAGRVDHTWREKDYTLAKLLYAAHVLTMDGQGNSREAKFSSLEAAGLTGIRIASLGLTFSKTRSASPAQARSGLMQTSYGQRFHDLLRLNFSGAVVANANVVPDESA